MKNKWISNKDAYASWEICFSIPKTVPETDMILNFQYEILDVAAQENVFHIEQTKFYKKSTNNREYLRYIKDIIHRDNLFHFLNGLNGTGTKTPAMISYYDLKSQIVSSEVDNMATLIHELHGKKIKGRKRAFPSSPVTISGMTVNLLNLSSQSIYAWISLHTNIWFPKIGDHVTDGIKVDIVDNSELARLHTPRLNNFLMHAKNITRRFGGEWGLALGKNTSIYSKVLTEEGILID